MPRHSAKPLSHKTRTQKETKNRSRAKYSREQIERMSGEERPPRGRAADQRPRSEGRTPSRSNRSDDRRSGSRGEERATWSDDRRTVSKDKVGKDDKRTTRSGDRRAAGRDVGRDAGKDDRRTVGRDVGRDAGKDDRRTTNSRGDAKPTTRRSSSSAATSAGSRSRVVRGENQDVQESPRPKRGAQKSNQQVPLRLNKFLADAGIASRRAADELIASGVVKVNGKVIKELGTKVHPADLVTVKGEPVSYLKHLTYIILNKPKDYITTTSDEKGRRTVMDLIPINQRLYPVGRLDRNTTGALIITNDGDLATRLMHPKYEVEREYVAGLDKKLKSDHARQIANGVELEDGTTGQAELWITPNDTSEVRIILKEGRNREVRRIFEHFGYEVKRLHRTRYAIITVIGMSRGEYRHLTRDEVRALKKLVGLGTDDMM